MYYKLRTLHASLHMVIGKNIYTLDYQFSSRGKVEEENAATVHHKKFIHKLYKHLTKFEQTVASSLYFPIPVIKAVLSAKFVSKEVSYTTDAGSGSIVGCSSGSANVSRHCTLVRASCNVAILPSPGTNVRRDYESIRKGGSILIREYYCGKENNSQQQNSMNSGSAGLHLNCCLWHFPVWKIDCTTRMLRLWTGNYSWS